MSMQSVSLSTSLRLGWQCIKERPSLGVLLYVFAAVPAFILTLPVFSTFVETVGQLGFGPDLLEAFDITVWSAVSDEAVSIVGNLLRQLLWVIPFYLLWVTAARMGLIYALHHGAIWPFWRGVGYYTWPALILAFLFLPIRAIWVGVVIIGSGLLTAIVPGAMGVFWAFAVILPFLLVVGLAIINMMQRYAQMLLVMEHVRAGEAFSRGFQWLFRYGFSWRLYGAWFGIVLVVAVLGAYLSGAWRPVGMGIWMYIVVQQGLLLTRSMLAVGWTGSEVNYVEKVVEDELPVSIGY